MQLDAMYPFSSVTDLKRQLWIQMDGDSRWAPERVFIGVPQADGTLRPLEFHWSIAVGATLPDPRPAEARVPSPALVDEAGNRKPIAPTMLGALTLETALSVELQQGIPVLVAICLDELAPASEADLTAQLYQGFYQLYFPWLTAPEQVLNASRRTEAITVAYAAAAAYMFGRTGRIEMVQAALAGNRYIGDAVTMHTMVRLRWILPIPAVRPDSLERTFYSLRATPSLPFLRYFPPSGKGTPILKLGLKDDGSLVIEDPKVMTHYLSQPAPVTKGGVIVGRIPIASPHAETGAAFTLYMFEDGSTDITFEVPQRGATYIAAVAIDATRVLASVVVEMGFPPGTQPVLRDIHATYNWTNPNPRADTISYKVLKSRVAGLTPFFDEVPLVEQSLGVFTWRATSNYESESAIFTYITQFAQADTVMDDAVMRRTRYIAEITKKFGISPEQAAATMERWFERRTAAVAPVPGVGAGALAVPKHNTGVQIVIRGSNPDYRIELQGVDNYLELQRVLSVTAVLLGAPAKELLPVAPSAALAALGQQVAVEDAQVEDSAVAQGGAPPEEAEVDFDQMAAMMEFMEGAEFGAADDEEASAPVSEEAPVAAQLVAAASVEVVAEPPDLAAAVAAVSEECRGALTAPGEPALKIKPEYYISRLSAKDNVLFSYKIPKGSTGSKKSYARSCQAPDGRQPDIMSLAEYARIQRCYEGRVRFVNLPPQSPADLPAYPGYNPKKKIPDEAFKVDPASALPLWSVLVTENLTTPGTFNYLLCAELWCDRDNMPLLTSEFESTEGRGFRKPANTCPFCGGSIIENLEAPAPGETVIKRPAKGGQGKVHSFIGHLSRGITHPEKGVPLPCCHTTPSLLKYYLEEAHYGRLKYGIAAQAAEGGEEEYAEAPPEQQEEAVTAEEPQTDYAAILGSMQAQYILGADKTLGAGKIGLLPDYLDEFFGQNGTRSIISRGPARSTFNEGAIVFVRIGVDRRLQQRGLNLFAGLTPLMGFDSAEATRRHFLSRRMVRAFESANYGTMVQEFAARATVTDAEITASLPAFAAENGYALGPFRAHVARLYKAWSAFLSYLADQREPKHLRHIEHLLAQPDVLMPRGMLIVALEQGEDEKVRVICPSFGIPSASIFGDVPIAFMWRDRRLDTWEPIVLYNGTRQAVRWFGDRSAELQLLPPQIRVSIERWLREWRSSSLGCGRPTPPPHVWTPDRDTSGLPRLSTILTRVRGGFHATALVRDRSNRLAGVIMTGAAATGTAASIGAGAAPRFFLPSLDDGTLATSLPRVYEAEGIPSASLDAYLQFYTSEIVSSYPTLRPEKILAKITDAGTQVVGFQTVAGVMIPVTQAAMPVAPTLPVQQVDLFPWERDALVLRAPDAVAGATAAIEESTASVEEQMAEAYQYLRVSVARWLRRDPAANALKQDLAQLLSSQLPLYERRKRMDIRLEPLVRSWLAPEQTEERRALSLLREDCLTLPGEAECRATGTCSWSGGRCLIHAPYRTEGTDPVRIFTARLSDELLRYSAQRRELLEDGVPMIRTPRGVIRQENELYVATKAKETAAGLLERLGFMTHVAASFPEEMLRFAGLEEAATVGAEEGEEGEVAQPVRLSEALPPAWTAAGFQVPTPALDLPDARFLAWAAGTGRSIADWTKYLGIRRKTLGVPGDPARPFQWSIQDFYVLAALTMANMLFVRQGADGRLILDRWVAPPNQKTDKPIYMVLWGPRQLLVTKGMTAMKGIYAADLPEDLRALLDVSRPMPDTEAKGAIESAKFVTSEQQQTPKTELSEKNTNTNTNASEAPPQAAATQGEGDGGAMPAPRPAPTL
jgi:hypothetical protein